MNRVLSRRLDRLENQVSPGPVAVWFPDELRPTDWAEAEQRGVAVSFPDWRPE